MPTVATQAESDADGLGDVCDYCLCMGDMNEDDWLSPDDVISLVNQLLPYSTAYYWVLTNGGDCGDISGDGWKSPDDVIALVGELLPYASSNYWVECDM